MSVSIIDRLQSGEKNISVAVPPQNIDEYLIEKVIFSEAKNEITTYVCKVKNNERDYALKICKISSDNKSTIQGVALNHRRMCMCNHSYICVGRDAFKKNDECNRFIEIFMPCELAEKTLYDYIKEKQNISEDTYIQWINGWIEALTQIHLNDYVHGDISLKNILMINGTPKFADFNDYSFGTPNYRHSSRIEAEVKYHTNDIEMNQFFKENPIHKRKAMDCYAFGCMLYDLFCHERNVENEIQPIRTGLYLYEDSYIFNNERIDIREPIGLSDDKDLSDNDKIVLNNRLSDIFINNNDYVSKILFFITKLMVAGGGSSRNTRIVSKNNNFKDLDAVQIYNDWKKFTEISKPEINQDEPVKNYNSNDKRNKNTFQTEDASKKKIVGNTKGIFLVRNRVKSFLFHTAFLCLFISIFGSIFYILTSINLFTQPFLIKIKIISFYCIDNFATGGGIMNLGACIFILVIFVLKGCPVIDKKLPHFLKKYKSYTIIIVSAIIFSTGISILYLAKDIKIIINEIVEKLDYPEECLGYIESIPRNCLNEKNRNVYYAFSPILKLNSNDIIENIQNEINIANIEKGIKQIQKNDNDNDNLYANYIEKIYQQLFNQSYISPCLNRLQRNKELITNEEFNKFKLTYELSAIIGIYYNFEDRLEKNDMHYCLLEHFFPIIVDQQYNKINKIDLYYENKKSNVAIFDKFDGDIELELERFCSFPVDPSCQGWLYFFYIFPEDKEFKYFREQYNANFYSITESFDATDQTTVVIYSPKSFEPFTQKEQYKDTFTVDEISKFLDFIKIMDSECKPAVGYQITLFR
ncbi:membrane protein containing Serine/threonine protein kinase-related domain protein [Candidatus Magnetomorum sp. HK-1]|nr:membrane protein containing Serine/threonine protein kinase-related domain protein [Candidatus Magnetomorum sp. HK-1]